MFIWICIPLFIEGAISHELNLEKRKKIDDVSLAI